MENLTAWLLMAACLIAGGLIGTQLTSDTVCPECAVCPEEVVCEQVLCEVCPELTDMSEVLLFSAQEEFLEELDDEDDLRCGMNRYDIDEISVSKLYDYSITYDGDDMTVDMNLKLKFDEDGERSCRENYDVSVYYEEDESPEIEYSRLY